MQEKLTAAWIDRCLKRLRYRAAGGVMRGPAPGSISRCGGDSIAAVVPSPILLAS